MKKPLPLTNPNWWPLAKTVPHIRAQVGSRDIADHGFLLAVNKYQVRVKVEQLDRRTNPPTLRSLLLLPAYRPGRNAQQAAVEVEALLLGGHRVQLVAHFSNTWMLRQCGDGPYLEPPYALFFWAPDVKKCWPSHAEPAPEGLLPTDTKSAPANRPKKPRLKRPPTLARRRTETILDKLCPNNEVPPEHAVATADIITAIKGEWRVVPNPQHVRLPSDNTLRNVIKDCREAGKRRAP
jgi:hypothetical protein